jgi:hypothetical protein
VQNSPYISPLPTVYLSTIAKISVIITCAKLFVTLPCAKQFLSTSVKTIYVSAYIRLTQHTCKYIKSYIRLHVPTFKKSSSGLTQNVKRKTRVLVCTWDPSVTSVAETS